jgi:heme/copper-type cytochrome/quinol oxidase subunit 1
MTKLKRLDILFLLTGILLLVPCVFLGDRTLDINLHDTYFVIEYLHIGILYFIIYGLFSLVYFLIRRHKNYVLGLLHLIFGTPLFLHFILTDFFFTDNSPRRYYANGDTGTAFDTVFADSIYVLVFLFILGQLLFLTNVIISIINSIKSGTRS